MEFLLQREEELEKNMNKIVIIIFTTFLLSQIEIDSSHVKPTFDLSKGFNIPGIIPKDITLGSNRALIQSEIDKIKQNALEFQVTNVTENDIVIMETNRGTMKLKLFPNIAPKHCKNFKKLANSGYYDETKFHRIIPGFMIQGGDINSRDNNPYNDGQGGPGWTVDAEFNDISHKRGILSMARSSDPNSAGSQFFICVADAFHLDGKYTAFGEVTENIHVADHIVNSPTDYIQVKRMSKSSIPDGEDPNDWITLRDSKTGKKLYSKIPKYKNKADFEYEMRKKIKSDYPSLPLTIKKIRIVNQLEINKLKNNE